MLWWSFLGVLVYALRTSPAGILHRRESLKNVMPSRLSIPLVLGYVLVLWLPRDSYCAPASPVDWYQGRGPAAAARPLPPPLFEPPLEQPMEVPSTKGLLHLDLTIGMVAQVRVLTHS